MSDPELAAMQQISEALKDLASEARGRVLTWVISKYDVMLSSPVSPAPPMPPATATEFVEFADLFHAANPQTHAERALVASYWLTSNGEAFQSQAANALLKDLGFQVPNITDALSQCMREKPALVVQVKKSGNSQQARKSYKVTDAGTRRVRAMLASNTGGANG